MQRCIRHLLVCKGMRHSMQCIQTAQTDSVIRNQSVTHVATQIKSRLCSRFRLADSKNYCLSIDRSLDVLKLVGSHEPPSEPCSIPHRMLSLKLLTSSQRGWNIKGIAVCLALPLYGLYTVKTVDYNLNSQAATPGLQRPSSVQRTARRTDLSSPRPDLRSVLNDYDSMETSGWQKEEAVDQAHTSPSGPNLETFNCPAYFSCSQKS